MKDNTTWEIVRIGLGKIYKELIIAEDKYAMQVANAIKEPSKIHRIKEVLPHVYYLVFNMDEISSEFIDENNTDYEDSRVDALVRILTGNKELDNGTYTVLYSYETRGATPEFEEMLKENKNTQYDKFQARGLAVEEVIAEEVSNTISWNNKFSDKVEDGLIKSIMDAIQNKGNLTHVGTKYNPGDFETNFNNLKGYIDIKYTTKMDKSKEDYNKRFLSMFHIQDRDANRPIEEIVNIVEKYTHYNKRELYNKENGRVLIYVYPEDGYWAHVVLKEVGLRIKKDIATLEKESYGQPIKVGQLSNLWYSQNSDK